MTDTSMQDQATENSSSFEQEWFAIAEEINEKVSSLPEVGVLAQKLSEQGHLELDDRSKFIALVNSEKDKVLEDKFGSAGSPRWQQFVHQWREWFNTKKANFNTENGHDLTNAEHIAYSSTPDPETFLRNLIKH